MAFRIPGRHLDVGPLTGEDIEKHKGMTWAFKESFCKRTAREPVTQQRVEGSKHQHRFQHQTEARDSVVKEAAYEVDEQGSDYQEYETSRSTGTPTGSPGASSFEQCNREVDRPRSPAPTTKPMKAT